MLIGVVSDTHFSSLAQGLPFLERLLAGPFRDVEMVLHAGDLINPNILDGFTDKPVFAVRGNLDHGHPLLPIKRIVTVGNYRIGMMHGWGAPEGLAGRVLREFSEDRCDVLVFGHSHESYCQRHGDVLLFNPGSATDRRSAPHHTVGLVELSDSSNGRIVSVDRLLGSRG